MDEAAAAERGPEARVVDGDDGAQAGRLVELEVDLAVVVRVEVTEEAHGPSVLLLRALRNLRTAAPTRRPRRPRPTNFDASDVAHSAE